LNNTPAQKIVYVGLKDEALILAGIVYTIHLSNHCIIQNPSINESSVMRLPYLSFSTDLPHFCVNMVYEQ
jgi:hypothetical protein